MEDRQQQIRRLQVMWSKGRDMLAAHLTALKSVKSEIGDNERFIGWCIRELRIYLGPPKSLENLENLLRLEDKERAQSKVASARMTDSERKASEPAIKGMKEDQISRLRVNWKKTQNMYMSFFSQLSAIQAEIGDLPFVDFCDDELGISLRRCGRMIKFLDEDSYKRVNAELKKARLARDARAFASQWTEAGKAAQAAQAERASKARAASERKEARRKQMWDEMLELSRRAAAQREAEREQEAERREAESARRTAQSRRDAARNALRAAARAAARADRRCERCGKPFAPARSTGRFCSPACRVAAHRKR